MNTQTWIETNNATNLGEITGAERAPTTKCACGAARVVN
jgi:hypothetical protein